MRDYISVANCMKQDIWKAAIVIGMFIGSVYPALGAKVRKKEKGELKKNEKL